MLDQAFMKVLIPLSNRINYNDGKLKGAVDYYFDKENEYENVLEEEKKFLDTFKKSYTPDNNIINVPYDTIKESVKNPFINQMNKDQIPDNYNNSGNLIPSGNNSNENFNKINLQDNNNQLNRNYPKNNQYDDEYDLRNKKGLNNQINNENIQNKLEGNYPKKNF